jgi:hypothetical protein
LLLALACCWSSTYPLTKIGVGSIPPITFISARSLIAAAFLLVILRVRGIALPKDGKAWKMFAQQRPSVMNGPAAVDRQSAKRIVATEHRGATGDHTASLKASHVREVHADGTELLTEPRIQRRRGNGVGRLPEVVYVLARRRKKECAGHGPHAAFSEKELFLDEGLYDSDPATARLISLVATEKMHVCAKAGRRLPVDPELELRRHRVVVKQSIRWHLRPDESEAAERRRVGPLNSR